MNPRCDFDPCGVVDPDTDDARMPAASLRSHVRKNRSTG